MATKKISALREATSALGTDIVPVIAGGATRKLSINNLFKDRSAISSVPLATIGNTSVLTADGTFDANTGWTAGT